MLEKIVLIFMDDLMILGRTQEEAIDRLKMVLKVAADHGLKIKWKKCQLITDEVDFLGMTVKNGTVRPSKDQVEAVRKFPEPENLKKLQSFLGLASYFRKFVENFSLIAKPLSDLFRGNSKFIFGQMHKEAFSKLKMMLMSAPVLMIFNPNAATELHTDACCSSYASILMQRQEFDGKFHPV
jgi:hypothetical protein